MICGGVAQTSFNPHPAGLEQDPGQLLTASLLSPSAWPQIGVVPGHKEWLLHMVPGLGSELKSLSKPLGTLAVALCLAGADAE